MIFPQFVSQTKELLIKKKRQSHKKDSFVFHLKKWVQHILELKQRILFKYVELVQ